MSPQGGTPAQAGALCERRMHIIFWELPHTSIDASIIHTVKGYSHRYDTGGALDSAAAISVQASFSPRKSS